MRFCYTLILPFAIISPQTFAHSNEIQLLCYMQKFVAIALHNDLFEPKVRCISNLNCDEKCSEIGPRRTEIA